MSSSRKNNSVLMKIWLATAAIATVVVVIFLIRSDIKDREREAELLAAINGSSNKPHYLNGNSANLANNSQTGTGTNAGDTSSSAGDKADNSQSGGEAVITTEPVATEEPTPEPTKEPEREAVSTNGIDPLKPIVALSFDDGPSIYTPRILATLQKYNGHATFFMVGENIDKYGEHIRSMKAAGCEPGNHTIDHKDLKTLSASEITREIEENQANINKQLGDGANGSYLVRPPYGNYNDTVKEYCKHPMIMWTVDTLDWKSRNAQAVFEEVKKSTKDGYIILMHDIYESTADAVDLIVPWLVEQGYQICSVSEMYAVRGETLKDGHAYRYTYTAEEYNERQNQNDLAQ